VERLAEEENGDLRAVRRRLETEHRLSVPNTTLRLWVRRRAVPTAPSVQTISERALALLSSEMSRLERSSAKLDLDRLGKVAQTLKTLDGLSRKQAAPGLKTLSDLSSDADPKPEREDVQASSQNGTTTLERIAP
jgi:hypothetical protein